MSKLLIQDRPLIVLPNLAKKIGLKEAIVLQQMHYWLNSKKIENIDETPWVFNTYKDWSKQFSCWSKITTIRSIKSLEKKNLIITGNFNKSRFDKTKWYTINYKKLEELKMLLPKSKSDIKLYATTLIDEIEEEPKKVEITPQESNENSMRSERSLDEINLITSYIDTKSTTKNNSLSLSSTTSLSGSLQREKTMIQIWNEVVEQNKRKVELTPSRINKLNKILSNHFKNDTSLWQNFCHTTMKSKFLRGEVTNFKINLDWLLKSPNLKKVMDGNYHRNEELLEKQNEPIDQITITNEIHKLNAPNGWKNILLILMEKRGIQTFCAWFKKNEFIRFENGILEIKAFSKFAEQWINTHYLDDFLMAAKQVYKNFEDIKFSYSS